MAHRHYLSIALLLTITVLVSWGLYFYNYPNSDTVNIKEFPLTIGRWAAQELPIDKADLALLETKNVFLRRYTDKEGNHIYLCIAYSQSNPEATNPPEVLYMGSGIFIIDKGKEYIKISSSNQSIQANWLLLDNNQSQQMVYYWFKVGNIYTVSYWKQRELAVFNNLIGKRTGSALIRISADIVNGQEKEAVLLINEFSSLVGPQLSSYLR